MLEKHSCLCLQCGRAFDIVMEMNADFSKQACPVCGGSNLIKHNPDSFLSALFRGGMGGG